MVKNKKLAKLGVFGAIFVLVLSFAFSTTSVTVFAQDGDTPANPQTPANPAADPVADPNTADSDTETTCAIEKVGWILCPVIESSSWIGDQAFSFLSRFFLETEPELVADESGTRDAWELARNIANLMFIMAFLVIIFSQVTGRGLNNYGIKKMLPRLVIAAIAVNVSYYICQLMVDLSNVMGYELKNFLVETASRVSDRAAMPVQTSIDNQTAEGNMGTLGFIAIGVLALGTVLYFLPVLMSVIVVIAVTCMTIILILLLRKAIIVLLVVLSPVAFVAYILPNTERYFQKWLKMFWQLLLVFPVVGLLFGAGQLASAIVLAAGTTTVQSDSGKSLYADESGKCIQLPTNNPDEDNSKAAVKPCGDGSTPFLLGLTAAGIAVAPLIAVWAVLKGALAAAGAVSGAVQNLTKPLSDRAQKRRAEDMERNALNKQTNAMLYNKGIPGTRAWKRKDARRAAMNNYAKSRNNRANSQYIADMAGYTDANGDLQLSEFGKKLAGGNSAAPSEQNRVMADVMNAQRQMQNDELKAASLISADMGDAQLEATLDVDQLDVNDPKVAAAIDELGKRGNFAALEKAFDRVASKGPSLSSRAMASTLSDNAGQLFTGGQIAGIARGAHANADGSAKSYMDTVQGNLEGGVLSAEKMASLNPSLVDEVSHVIGKTGSAAAAQKVGEEWAKVQTDDILNKKISRINATMSGHVSGNTWGVNR